MRYCPAIYFFIELLIGSYYLISNTKELIAILAIGLAVTPTYAVVDYIDGYS